jgi:hypothetical protein
MKKTVCRRTAPLETPWQHVFKARVTAEREVRRKTRKRCHFACETVRLSRKRDIMIENIENLILEHLKKIQAEQAAARERDAEILTRLSSIENGLARISRDEALTYTELVQDRHVVDKLKERIERIERRLELSQ